MEYKRRQGHSSLWLMLAGLQCSLQLSGRPLECSYMSAYAACVDVDKGLAFALQAYVVVRSTIALIKR